MEGGVKMMDSRGLRQHKTLKTGVCSKSDFSVICHKSSQRVIMPFHHVTGTLQTTTYPWAR